MAEGRSVEEISGDKRIVREYDADGKLLRIKVYPLTKGATADLPPVAPTPRPEPRAKEARRGEEKPTAAPRASPALFWRRNKEPSKEQPASERERAPPFEPVPAREPASEPSREVDAQPERAPIVYEEPEPAPEPAPEPTRAAEPVRVEYREPEPLPEPAQEPEPVPAPVLESPAPALRPAAFQVIAVEEVPPPPPPMHVRFAEEPERAGFTNVTVEPVKAPEAPAPEPAAIVAAVAPEPGLVEPVVAAPAPTPDPEPIPAPEPEPIAAAPIALRPPRYAEIVPDVEDRVDALLARADAPAKRRKRATIPAPSFEPLRKEPWEARLDKLLDPR